VIAYYNEIDPYCAKWLQNLMDAGHIAQGVIDTRRIEDVTPSELTGYTQCHFFAGIGGWALALRLAGWPDSRSAWTGSCPCQPFSAAGKGAGFDDERHLWPAWQHVISQCRPAVVFGEQVASKAVDAWIDLVQADMEGMGYAFGGIAFPAAGIGAPHIRDRTYWVADSGSAGSLSGTHTGIHRVEGGSRSRHGELERSGTACGLADANGRQRDGLAVMRGNERNGEDAGRSQGIGSAAACGDVRGMADSDRLACRQGRAINGRRDQGSDAQPRTGLGRSVYADIQRPGPTNGQWADADWLGCTDGKWRPVEPSTFPLAHGIPGRVGRLRAYGNAIVPAQAAEFVRAYGEAGGLMLGELEHAA
jgi:DNA (cytosine-5)-methyltransferase 1